MKTIMRVNKNQFGSIILYFQHIESWTVVRNKNIQYMTDKTNYSDWIHSGDLINCDFLSCHTGIEFDCEYRHELSIEISGRSFSSYQLDDLKKEINTFKRVEKKIFNDLDNIGEFLGNVDFKILLNILFNRLGVIGGLLDIDNTKIVFNGNNKLEFIGQVYSVLKESM